LRAKRQRLSRWWERLPPSKATLPSTTAEEKVTTLEDGATDYKRKIESLEADASIKQRVIVAMEADAASKQSKIATLEDDAATLNANVTSKQSAIETLQTETAGLQANAANKQTAIESLQIEVATLQSDATNKQTSIDSLHAETADLKFTCTILERDAKDKQGLIVSLEEKAFRLETRDSALGNQVAHLGGMIGVMKAEASILQAHSTRETRRVNELRAGHEELHVKIEDLKKEASILQEDVKETKEQLYATNHTNMDLTAEVHSLKVEITHMKCDATWGR